MKAIELGYQAVISVDKQNYCRDLRISFKKSLILGDISIPQALAGKATRKWLSTDAKSPAEKSSKAPDTDASGETIKAKTSLSFEMPSISPVRFYTPETTKASRRVIFQRKSVSTGRRIVQRLKKTGMINKGVGHKITKPSRKNILKMIKEEKKVVEVKKSEITSDQIQRISSILKNAPNPIEMARPLKLNDESSDEDVEEELTEGEAMIEDEAPKKFFKSGAKRTRNYQVINSISATVNRGNISLVSPKKKKKKVQFEDLQDSFRDERDEVNSIIKQLTVEEEEEVDGIIAQIEGSTDNCFRKRIPYKATDPVLIERQKTILELLITNKMCNEKTFRIFISEPESHKEEASKILDEMVCVTSGDREEEKLFPIFEKNFNPDIPKDAKTTVKRLWKPLLTGQLQIDAGQKEYGAKYCPECEMVYSVHEPEEETLHWNYHNALNILKFRGWLTENVILEVAEWGARGRVICVQETDTQAKLSRIRALLAVIDSELGAFNNPLPPKGITYLAVAHNQILGMCLVESIKSANRRMEINGIDYFSAESYPALCGILKVWTALPYRRQGVAHQLLNAVRKHFIFGHILSPDEIAFSSPTDAGKIFAMKFSKRNDFLVYP
ncbi:N-acetyltransferase eco [Sergentomyia squamirostris]